MKKVKIKGPGRPKGEPIVDVLLILGRAGGILKVKILIGKGIYLKGQIKTSL